MFQFKALIDGKWVRFDFHDVYGGKINIDGVDVDIPSIKGVTVRVFSGYHDMHGIGIYYGDKLRPTYNGLGDFVATPSSLCMYNTKKCKLLNDD